MTLSRTHIADCVKCPQFIKDPVLRGGNFVEKTGGGLLCWNGGFSTVFKVLKNGEYWAFKIWHTPLENIEFRYKKIGLFLTELNLSYFARSEYESKGLFNGEVYIPTHRMKWVDGLLLNEYIAEHILHPEKILALASKFRRMMKVFHANDIAHGDLQHGNIMVRNDGSLRVIDYDSMYVRGLMGMRDIIHGQAGYQHPSRINNEFIGGYLDNFSEILIYLSLVVYAELPELWNNETDWLLFSKEDLSDPETCVLMSELIESKNPLIRYLTRRLIGILHYIEISEIPSLELILVPTEMNKSSITNIIDQF